VTDHRVVLRPGDAVEVVLEERLQNGFSDRLGVVELRWQERDAPPGEVSTRGRELQLAVSAAGRAGPLVVRCP
jgi:hypothetical protein